MKVYVEPVSLGVGLVLLSLTLPRLFSTEMCSVNFINENGVQYEKSIPCDDVGFLTNPSALDTPEKNVKEGEVETIS